MTSHESLNLLPTGTYLSRLKAPAIRPRGSARSHGKHPEQW